MKIIIPRLETTYFHKTYDGGSKYMQQFSEELVKRGYEVEIVTTKLRNNLNLKSLVYNGVKYTFISPEYTGKRLIPFNMFYKRIFTKNLTRYLKTQEFDILHSPEAYSYDYLHNKKRKPVIMQSWALEPFYGHECNSHKGFKKLYVNLFLKRYWLYCIRNADCVTADLPFQIPSILALGVKEDKINFIPNGIYWKKIQERKKNFINRRKELGFKDNDLVLISVCQLTEEKGNLEILEAFKLAKQEIPNLKMIMIGKGILEETMKDFIQSNRFNDDIKMLKDIKEEELFDYHLSSDIFINGVRTNNLMLSIQEGMACGLPIVSSAQPFLVEDGVNGYVVGINNPKGLAHGIISISHNSGKRRNMGNESTILSEEYDWSNVVDKAEEVYRRLIINGKCN
jgi:glycosyltransferase involved in cell wall biosynthesis